MVTISVLIRKKRKAYFKKVHFEIKLDKNWYMMLSSDFRRRFLSSLGHFPTFNCEDTDRIGIRIHKVAEHGYNLDPDHQQWSVAVLWSRPNFFAGAGEKLRLLAVAV